MNAKLESANGGHSKNSKLPQKPKSYFKKAHFSPKEFRKPFSKLNLLNLVNRKTKETKQFSFTKL